MEENDNADHFSPNNINVLEKALSKMTKKCVNSFKLSEFKKQFRPIHKQYPGVLENLHGNVCDKLLLKIQEEVQLMMEEENIPALMERLDKLRQPTSDQSMDVVAWRPTGLPSDDVRAHVYPVYCQHYQQLEKIVDQLVSQNTLLQQKWEKHYSRLGQSCSTLHEYVDTWQKASSCVTEAELEELQTFVLKSVQSAGVDGKNGMTRRSFDTTRKPAKGASQQETEHC